MISTKSQAPAFAGAASRRQAKYQIISNNQNSKFQPPSPRLRVEATFPSPSRDCVAIESREKINADPPEVYKSDRGQRGG